MEVLDRPIDRSGSRERPGESVVDVGSIGIRLQGSLEEPNCFDESAPGEGEVPKTKEGSGVIGLALESLAKELRRFFRVAVLGREDSEVHERGDVPFVPT